MNNFIVPYYGNKYKEAKNTIEHIKIDWKTLDYIIEPFCGGAGFSRYIAHNIPDYKGKFIWCDTDSGLIGLMQIMIDGKFSALLEETKKDAEAITTKEAFQTYRAKQDAKTGEGYYKMKRIRGGFRENLFNKQNVQNFIKSKQAHKPLLDLMSSGRIIVKNQSSNKTIDEAIELSKTANVLVFSDPPYFQSCNNFYDSYSEKICIKEDDVHEDGDTSGMFVDILKSMQTPSLISVCVLNHSILMAELYKGYVASVYKKRYNQSHYDKATGKIYAKMSKHMILYNHINETCLVGTESESREEMESCV